MIRRASTGDGLGDFIVGVDPWGGRFPIRKLDAHVKKVRHLAVSIFIVDGSRLLLQRHASTKYHTGGLWSNTCCSHPLWGEGFEQCAHRTLQHELGFDVPLREFGVVEYKTPVGTLFENEIVHCFRGTATAAADLSRFNRSEVQALAWAELEQIERDIRPRPYAYTPWFGIYVRRYAQRDGLLQIVAPNAAG